MKESTCVTTTVSGKKNTPLGVEIEKLNKELVN